VIRKRKDYLSINDLLEKRGFPRLNWVIAAGQEKERPDGRPRRTGEVRWGRYHTPSWGQLDYFERLDRSPIWRDRNTGEERPGVILCEWLSQGDAYWPDEYSAAVAPADLAEAIQRLLKSEGWDCNGELTTA